MDPGINPSDLLSDLAGDRSPLLIDVRKSKVFRAASDMVSGALRRDPERISSWAKELPRASTVVAYSGRGHDDSQGTARALRAMGFSARYLIGGIEDGWKPAGGTIMHKPDNASTRWVTSERPKIDRLACSWLIARFIDPEAELVYVPAGNVLSTANEAKAIAYDSANASATNGSEFGNFDAFLNTYRLSDPALQQLAAIVRAADTASFDHAPQASGLAAISTGLSNIFKDDHQMLKHGMVMYDALYAWCRKGHDEMHTWNPAPYDCA